MENWLGWMSEKNVTLRNQIDDIKLSLKCKPNWVEISLRFWNQLHPWGGTCDRIPLGILCNCTLSYTPLPSKCWLPYPPKTMDEIHRTLVHSWMCYLDSLIGGLNAIIWLKSHPNSHGNACQQAIWHSCKTFDKICNVFGEMPCVVFSCGT